MRKMNLQRLFSWFRRWKQARTGHVVSEPVVIRNNLVGEVYENRTGPLLFFDDHGNSKNAAIDKPKTD